MILKIFKFLFFLAYVVVILGPILNFFSGLIDIVTAEDTSRIVSTLCWGFVCIIQYIIFRGINWLRRKKEGSNKINEENKVSEKMKTKSFVSEEQVYQPSQKTLDAMKKMESNAKKATQEFMKSFRRIR